MPPSFALKYFRRKKGRMFQFPPSSKTLSGKAKDVMKGSLQRLPPLQQQQLSVITVLSPLTMISFKSTWGLPALVIIKCSGLAGKKIVTAMVAECQSGDNFGQNIPVSQLFRRQHNSGHYNTNTEEKYFVKLEVKLHKFFKKWTQPSYSEILFQFRTFKRKTLLWVKTWKFVSSNLQPTAEMSFL